MKFIPETHASIKDAVKLWCSNQTKAEETYGHISNWDTSKVTDMSNLFYEHHCKYFNDDISKWNVSNVTNMYRMFHGAWDFNQDISQWNVANVTNMGEMFRGSGISSANKPRWLR